VLLGLACGDAVGTTVEFSAPGTFTPLVDMVGGGPFRLDAGEWTDDTSMALCLAESLLDRGGHDPADQLRRYVLWWHTGYLSSNGRCFDIGGTTRSQLARFERTGEPHDPSPDQEDAANGSLMRLAAVPARWHRSVENAAALSGESSRTTHAADRPVDACRVLGAMTAALIDGVPAREVLHPEFWKFGPLHPAVEAVARGSWQAKQPPRIRGTGYCVDALEAALWAVAGAVDFRSAILRAANLGDDADTTAAIAGQLAGARWGASGIPDEWTAKLVSADRIRSLAARLHEAGSAGAPSMNTAWQHEGLVHAWWVEPGSVLAGEYPGHPKARRAREKIDVLVDHGIRTFVDLTTPADGLAPYHGLVADVAVKRALDVRVAPCPIPDFSVIDDAGYDTIVSIIESARARGAVYVHCWGGVGRTGTVIGCLLADLGLSSDQVLARLVELRAGTHKASRHAPETDQQRDVIARRAGRLG
jgi:ADP-ribosylglycohydrolase